MTPINQLKAVEYEHESIAPVSVSQAASGMRSLFLGPRGLRARSINFVYGTGRSQVSRAKETAVRRHCSRKQRSFKTGSRYCSDLLPAFRTSPSMISDEVIGPHFLLQAES
jgi:hypothetical protein